jgi:AraC family transcriptional regulator
MWYISVMKTLKETTRKDYAERMLTVLQHIQQHLDEPLALEELASLACFSPFHFHRIFRGMVGESVKGHIRRLRLERAASRLKNGQRSVTDIAFEAGFEAHESFTRAFGTVFGVSPRDYRRSQQVFVSQKGSIHFIPNRQLSEFHPNRLENETMDVKLVSLETMKVAYVHHVGPYDECGKAWETLCTWAGPQGLIRPDTMFIGLSYDDPDVTPLEKIRYDACLRIDTDIDPEGDIGMQSIEAATYAMTTYFGPYDQFSKTYAQLCGQWIPAHGYEIASRPSIEVYQNSPEDTEPEDLITDVHVPLDSI